MLGLGKQITEVIPICILKIVYIGPFIKKL